MTSISPNIGLEAARPFSGRIGLFIVAIVCLVVSVTAATEVPGEVSMEAAFQGECNFSFLDINIINNLNVYCFWPK